MIYRVSILGLVALVTACATGGGMSRKDILKQYDKVGELDRSIKEAEQNQGKLLASEGLAQAKERLEEAVALAADGKKEKANNAAEKGLGSIAAVKLNMDKARELMREVLTTRERAESEGAPAMFEAAFKTLDEDFRKATVLIEKGNLDKAMEMRPDLVKRYSELELKALKKGTVEAAKAAIAQAKKSDAEEYAPKTLKEAEEEKKLVSVVLEADRTQTEKASAHAQKTIWLANRASAITELAKHFESKEFSWEDMILWYQDQLAKVNEPLGGELPFDKKNDEMVTAFRESTQSVVKALADARAMMNESQDQITKLKVKLKKEKKEADEIIAELLGASRKEMVKLKKKYADRLTGKGKKVAETEQRELEIKQKFNEIKESFTEDEATVTLDGKNILITVQGFYFSPGETDIQARNFGLLNKVVSGIQKFPECKIVVSGHTDSRGNNKRNQRLSEKRAANIAKFMVELASIPENRIESKGYGETKPVSSNETREGRELNRRIEVLIINEEKPYE